MLCSEQTIKTKKTKTRNEVKPMARYEINSTGPDCWSILRLDTGKYVVVNESRAVCDGVLDRLQGRISPDCSELQEIADSILNAEKR